MSGGAVASGGASTRCEGHAEDDGGDSAADNVQCAISYDPWGDTNPNSSATVADDPHTNPCGTDTSSSGPGHTDSDVLFRQARRDTTTGNYQFGSRTYDPANATWLQADTYRAVNGGGESPWV